jgi:hypothetical protein
VEDYIEEGNQDDPWRKAEGIFRLPVHNKAGKRSEGKFNLIRDSVSQSNIEH